jgi:hypothetical protein
VDLISVLATGGLCFHQNGVCLDKARIEKPISYQELVACTGGDFLRGLSPGR